MEKCKNVMAILKKLDKTMMKKYSKSLILPLINLYLEEKKINYLKND